jgi:hypothetical protein
VSTDHWQIDRLDLDGYVPRLGVPQGEPSRMALAELHEAHVRAFTFDNIDVLLDRHPAVSLDDLLPAGPNPPVGPTEHRALRPGEIEEWLEALEVPLTSDEEAQLLTKLRARGTL